MSIVDDCDCPDGLRWYIYRVRVLRDRVLSPRSAGRRRRGRTHDSARTTDGPNEGVLGTQGGHRVARSPPSNKGDRRCYSS